MKCERNALFCHGVGLSTKNFTRSMGRGNTMVEFFSVDISASFLFSVILECRDLSRQARLVPSRDQMFREDLPEMEPVYGIGYG